MARNDQIETAVSIERNGRYEYIGQFTRFSGGELESSDVKWVPAAGWAERARGGRQTVGNVTVGREDDGSIDVKQLAAMRGKTKMHIRWTPQDADGNPIDSRSIRYTGVLLAVRPGEADTMGDDISVVELEMSCDSIVS